MTVAFSTHEHRCYALWKGPREFEVFQLDDDVMALVKALDWFSNKGWLVASMPASPVS